MLSASPIASQIWIIEQLDCEYLADKLILNPHQLGAFLSKCPLFLYRVTEHSKFSSLTNEHYKLLAIFKAAPKCIVKLLEKAWLRKLITTHDQIIAIIKVNPQCINTLLSYAEVIRLIKPGMQVANLIEALPQTAALLLSNPDLRALITSRFEIEIIIKAAPDQVKTLLKDARILTLLLGYWKEALESKSAMLTDLSINIGYEFYPTALSLYANVLFKNREFRALITTGYNLASLVSIAPHSADILLQEPTLRALITTGEQVGRIIKAAPHWSDTLLKDLTLQALVTSPVEQSKIKLRDYLKTHIQPLLDIIEVAPQWASILRCQFLCRLFKIDDAKTINEISIQSADTFLQDNRLAMLDNYQFVSVIKVFPKHAVTFLSIPMLLAKIEDGFMIAIIIEAAPHCADILLRILLNAS